MLNTPRMQALRRQLHAAKQALADSQEAHAENPTTGYAGHVTSKSNEVKRITLLILREEQRVH